MKHENRPGTNVIQVYYRTWKLNFLSKLMKLATKKADRGSIKFSDVKATIKFKILIAALTRKFRVRKHLAVKCR